MDEWHSQARERLEQICQDQRKEIAQLTNLIDQIIDTYKLSPERIDDFLQGLYEDRRLNKH